LLTYRGRGEQLPSLSGEPSPMSDLPLKADLRISALNVRFAPTADIAVDSTWGKGAVALPPLRSRLL